MRNRLGIFRFFLPGEGIQLSHSHEYRRAAPRLYHLISGRRSERLHHNPAFGAWLRRTGPFYRSAVEAMDQAGPFTWIRLG